MPILQVTDVDASIDFYTVGLGFHLLENGLMMMAAQISPSFNLITSHLVCNEQKL
jgi:catechol 2,3-dioxygenase-like lactoylglutathione lyase family enzyme